MCESTTGQHVLPRETRQEQDHMKKNTACRMYGAVKVDAPLTDREISDETLKSVKFFEGSDRSIAFAVLPLHFMAV